MIIPPENKWEPIQQIRQAHDRHIHRWMPHINLIYPFRPKSQFESLQRTFRDTCAQINSFEITFSKLKYFDHGRQNFTMWLHPEPIDLVRDLQAKLLTIVPDCDDVNRFKAGFTPHLSLGQVKGKQNLSIIITELQNSWINLRFKLNYIYFIAREPYKFSKFEIIKKFSLGR